MISDVADECSCGCFDESHLHDPTNINNTDQNNVTQSSTIARQGLYQCVFNTYQDISKSGT